MKTVTIFISTENPKTLLTAIDMALAASAGKEPVRLIFSNARQLPDKKTIELLRSYDLNEMFLIKQNAVSCDASLIEISPKEASLMLHEPDTLVLRY